MTTLLHSGCGASGVTARRPDIATGVKLLRRLLLLSVLMLVPGTADVSVCTASTVPVAFGAYLPSATSATDGVGTINISCDKAPKSGNAITISTGGSGTFTNRVMHSGTWSLNYNLYTTSSRVQVWGDGTGGSAIVTYGNSTNTSYAVTIYGRITALQNVGAGSYADSLVVTIAF